MQSLQLIQDSFKTLTKMTTGVLETKLLNRPIQLNSSQEINSDGSFCNQAVTRNTIAFF